MNNLSKNIATTIEQSERLLAMGVNPETADMEYYRDVQGIWHLHIRNEKDTLTEFITPAWSLVRIISMIPFSFLNDKENSPYHSSLIKKEFGYAVSIKRGHNDCLFGTYLENDPIRCYISIIEWLIKNNYFNEEYLNEQKKTNRSC